jgi:ankyrin repeat protein
MEKRICFIIPTLLLALSSAHPQAASLFNVVYGGGPELVQATIDRGAKVNAVRSEGTPLILAAAYNKNPEVITVLLNAGADLGARDLLHGGTALHWAASYNANPEIVAALLNAGADVNALNTLEGQSVLMWAAIKNPNPEVILTLLRAGADASFRDKYGKIALDYAKANEKIKDTDAQKALEAALQ